MKNHIQMKTCWWGRDSGVNQNPISLIKSFFRLSKSSHCSSPTHKLSSQGSLLLLSELLVRLILGPHTLPLWILALLWILAPPWPAKPRPHHWRINLWTFVILFSHRDCNLFNITLPIIIPFLVFSLTLLHNKLMSTACFNTVSNADHFP